MRFASSNLAGGRVSNPFNNLDRVKHWHMILMCICCAISGVAVGQLIDVDEDKLRRIVIAPFERDAIEAEFKKIFEVQPSLAATFLRLAIADAAKRGEALGRYPPRSKDSDPQQPFTICKSDNGLDEARRIVDSIQVQFPEAGKMDIAALGAIAAVRLLRGPADKINYMWGRGDNGTLAEKKSVTDRMLESQPDQTVLHGRFLSGGSSTNTIFTQLQQLVPTLNLEEAMALMAAHCAGEFHPEVSGIDGREYNRLSRHKFFLGSHYYQLLIDHAKVARQAELPDLRGSEVAARITTFDAKTGGVVSGSKCPVPPRMLEAVADMKHPVTGKPMQRKALITAEEMQSIALDGEGVEVATSFATDPAMWQQYFASGMTKLLNAHCHTLKSYHSANSIKADKAERERANALVSRDYRPASEFGWNTEKRRT